MITEKVKINAWGNKEREQLKAEYFVDSNVIAQSQSELAKRETNDCVVRAFMCALDISYEQAHAYIKKEMKREDRHGTYTFLYSKNVIGRIKNGKRISFIGAHPDKTWMQKNIANTTNKKILANPKYKKPTAFTIKAFLESHPVGRFVLIVEGHAIAVVDGVLYGNSNEQYSGLYRSVWYGFKMN
jgi:hypothetical protein